MPEKITAVHASQATDTPSAERRVSIWSVPIDLGPWFYLLLVSHTAPLVFLLWWTDTRSATQDNIASIIVNVTSGAAPIIFVAAVATIIELEVLVVLREWYRERAARKRAEERQRAEEQRAEERQEGYREGLEEGIERGRQLEREEQAARGKSSDQNGKS